MELLNIKPGPKVGRVLDHLMEKVLDDPENNTQETLESFAREFYHNNTDKESEV
jgi:tRNA nucleotidyltransferase (CCA-adding enzyme)